MDSTKYMLTRFTRVNNLKTSDEPFGFGVLAPKVSTVAQSAILGYKRGATLYAGTAMVGYNRLDLGKLFQGVTPKVTLFQPRNYRVVFAELLRKYGLPGHTEEVILGDCPDVSIPIGEPPTEVTITCSAGVLYTGTVKVTIEPKIMPLPEIVLDTEYDIITPTFLLTNSKLVLERRYYNYDFSYSPYIASLRAIKPGQYAHAVDSWYVKMLNDPDVKQECGNITWVWEGYGGSNPYSLYKSTCLYNGPARGHPLANGDYNYVAVFDCPGNMPPHANHVGNFIFHYN